jgi:hypothetical protein
MGGGEDRQVSSGGSRLAFEKEIAGDLVEQIEKSYAEVLSLIRGR